MFGQSRSLQDLVNAVQLTDLSATQFTSHTQTHTHATNMSIRLHG